MKIWNLLTCFVLSGIALTCFCAAQQIQINKENKTVAITTSGEAEALSDVAVVTVGFRIYGKDQDGTYAEASRTSNAIITALTSAGVPKEAIESSAQAFNPIDPGNDDKTRFIQGLRFEFSQSWHITVAASAAATVLHAAIPAGANESGDIEWELKNDDGLEAEAAKKALEHARQIATQMAAGLGARLGGLLYASNQTPPRGIFAALGLGGATVETESASVAGAKRRVAPVAVSPQKKTRNATVYAVFAIE